MSAEAAVDLSQHHKPENLSDHFALLFVKFLRIFADTFSTWKRSTTGGTKTYQHLRLP